MTSPFTPRALAAYLAAVHGRAASDVRVTPLGGGRQGDKGYGYGIPLRVDYTLDGKPRRAVVETVRPGPFGHEHMADRAQSLLWAHSAFGRLPRHVASLDVGAVRSSGELVPLGSAEELFMLAEFIEGHEYADDLLALRAGRALAPLDEARADALCDYLVEIHRVAGPDPGLYVRRVRELVDEALHDKAVLGIAHRAPEAERDRPVGMHRLDQQVGHAAQRRHQDHVRGRQRANVRECGGGLRRHA